MKKIVVWIICLICILGIAYASSVIYNISLPQKDKTILAANNITNASYSFLGCDKTLCYFTVTLKNYGTRLVTVNSSFKDQEIIDHVKNKTYSMMIDKANMISKNMTRFQSGIINIT